MNWKKIVVILVVAFLAFFMLRIIIVGGYYDFKKIPKSRLVNARYTNVFKDESILNFVKGFTNIDGHNIYHFEYQGEKIIVCSLKNKKIVGETTSLINDVCWVEKINKQNDWDIYADIHHNIFPKYLILYKSGSDFLASSKIILGKGSKKNEALINSELIYFLNKNSAIAIGSDCDDFNFLITFLESSEKETCVYKDDGYVHVISHIIENSAHSELLKDLLIVFPDSMFRDKLEF